MRKEEEEEQNNKIQRLINEINSMSFFLCFYPIDMFRLLARKRDVAVNFRNYLIH